MFSIKQVYGNIPNYLSRIQKRMKRRKDADF